MKLIFIHGSGNTGAVWQYQVQYFPEAEAVDLPGHLSPGEPCTSIEDYTAWLHRYVVEQGYAAPVLAGHSLGGAIALMYALQHPRDTRALILIGTGAKLRVAPQYLSEMRKGIEDPSTWAQDFVAPQYSRIDPELRKTLMARTVQVGAKVQLNDFTCCDRFDVMNRLDQIKVPTLVLCGSEDLMTPPKYGSYLASQIEGARLVVVDGTHFLFAERPQIVNQAIEQFLHEL